MSWSLGEIRALSIKAARGAGMPWGLAEEAGFAVRWLEERSLPGVEALANYLGEIEWDAENSCPISTGAYLSDFNDWRETFPANLKQPILVLPFLANVHGSENIEVKWADCVMMLSENGISCSSNSNPVTESKHECIVSASDQVSPCIANVTRVPDDRKEFVHMLEKFAHKTYAPSTEESRAKGAGAGLTDND